MGNILAETSMNLVEKDVEGFEVFTERYKRGIIIEQAAIQNLI